MIVVAGVLGLVMSAPAILSSHRALPLLNALASRRCGVDVTLGGASFSHRGPTTVRDVTLQSADGQIKASIREGRLDVGWLDFLRGIAPRSVTLRGGDVLLHRSKLPTDRSRFPYASWCGDVAIESTRLRLVDDVASPAQSVIVAPLDFELADLDQSEPSIHVRGRLELVDAGNASPPAVDVDGSIDASRCDITWDAQTFPLQPISPWLAWFVPGVDLAGVVDGSGSLTSTPERFTGDFASTVRGASFAIPRVVEPPLRDSHLTLLGSLDLQRSPPRASFRNFKIVSSFLGVDANGTLEAGPDNFIGDLAGSASVDVGRALARGGGWLQPILGENGLIGHLALTVDPLGEGRFHGDVQGEGIQFRLPSQRGANLQDCFVRGDFTLGTDQRSIDIRDGHASFRFGDITGAAALRIPDGSRQIDVGLDVRYRGDTTFLVGQLGDLIPGTIADLNGEVDVSLIGALDAKEGAFEGKVLSPGGVGFTYLPGDAYSFHGVGLDARYAVTWPRSEPHPIDHARGQLQLFATNATIRKDPVEEFVLEATLAPGRLDASRCQMKTAGNGFVSATANYSWNRVDPPRFHLDAEAKNVEVARFAVEIAALTTAFFAADPTPFRVTTTSRMTGQVSIDGEGSTTSDILATMRGGGSLRLGSGDVIGSPALARWSDEETTAIERLVASFKLRPGVVISNVELKPSNHHVIVYHGESGADGSLRFILPPDQLLTPSFLARNPDLPFDCFSIGGSWDHPMVRLPHPAKFEAMAERDGLPQALEELER